MNFGVAIEVAIGLILLYLLLSLVVTSANEFIAQTFDMRARHLKGALTAMVSGRTGDGAAAFDKLLAHPFLSVAGQVSRSGPFRFAAGFGTNVPSYVKAGDFSGALTSIVKSSGIAEAIGAAIGQLPNGALKKRLASLSTDDAVAAVHDLGDGVDEAKLKAILSLDIGGAIAHLPEGDLKSSLQALHARGVANATSVEKEIEGWFDTMMERVSGAFKRSMNVVGLGIGLLLAIAVNADTFRVAEALWKDEALRGGVVKIAEAHLACPVQAAGDAVKLEACKAPTNAWADLQKLPIGWKDFSFVGRSWLGMVQRVAGWLVTAMALSLGAPFWFDMLSKAMNLRAALNPQQAAARAAKPKTAGQ